MNVPITSVEDNTKAFRVGGELVAGWPERKDNDRRD
jgi:hypothetical protein